MKVGLLPRGPLHRNPIRISRASQQRHRSPEPDCPHRSSLPGIPETASLGPDQSPQRNASSDPPQMASESYSANQITKCVFTQAGSGADIVSRLALSALPPKAALAEEI